MSYPKELSLMALSYISLNEQLLILTLSLSSIDTPLPFVVIIEVESIYEPDDCFILITSPNTLPL